MLRSSPGARLVDEYDGLFHAAFRATTLRLDMKPLLSPAVAAVRLRSVRFKTSAVKATNTTMLRQYVYASVASIWTH